jgi:hypothetical protein
MDTSNWNRGRASVGTLVLVALLLASAGAAATKRHTGSQAPVITSIKPTSGRVGTFVTIAGSNLTGATIFFGNVPATTPANPEGTPDTSTLMTTTVPAGAVTGPITVDNGNLGKATSPVAFMVTAVPKATPAPKLSILRVAPASAKPGTMVAITGRMFVAGTSVRFGGVKAKLTIVMSTTKLKTRVPVGAKSGKLTVITPYGTTASVTRFTVI